MFSPFLFDPRLHLSRPHLSTSVSLSFTRALHPYASWAPSLSRDPSLPSRFSGASKPERVIFLFQNLFRATPLIRNLSRAFPRGEESVVTTFCEQWLQRQNWQALAGVILSSKPSTLSDCHFPRARGRFHYQVRILHGLSLILTAVTILRSAFRAITFTRAAPTWRVEVTRFNWNVERKRRTARSNLHNDD